MYSLGWNNRSIWFCRPPLQQRILLSFQLCQPPFQERIHLFFGCFSCHLTKHPPIYQSCQSPLQKSIHLFFLIVSAATLAKVYFSSVGCHFNKGSTCFFSCVGHHFSNGSSYFFDCVGRHFSKKVPALFQVCRSPLQQWIYLFIRYVSHHIHYGYLSRGGQCWFYLSEGGKSMSDFALLKDKSDYIMCIVLVLDQNSQRPRSI